jgi:hypothetical protein
MAGWYPEIIHWGRCPPVTLNTPLVQYQGIITLITIPKQNQDCIHIEFNNYRNIADGYAWPWHNMLTVLPIRHSLAWNLSPRLTFGATWPIGSLEELEKINENFREFWMKTLNFRRDSMTERIWIYERIEWVL